MPLEVRFTEGAVRDLEDIHDYIARVESAASAALVLGKLRELCDSLAQFPERGAFPPELLELGIRDFRQMGWKPYRVIYRVVGRQLMIQLVADGRRDMRSLLSRRLLGH